MVCVGNWLYSIKSWTELNFSDTWYLGDILKVSQECQRKRTQTLENHNYEWPWTDDAQETSILKGEMKAYSSLASTPHTLSQLWKRDVKNQEKNSHSTQTIYDMAIQLRYLLASSDPKEGKNTKMVWIEN